VSAALISGLFLNSILGGWGGTLDSLKGGAYAFGLMLLLHLFGAMGAGDVKLFGAIGAVIGANLVLHAFVVVVITGGVLAIISSLRARIIRQTLRRVWLILYSILCGWKPPRFPTPDDRRQTIPYGLAAIIPEGYRAMTVKIDDETGVAGFILPGAVVDVLAVITAVKSLAEMDAGPANQRAINQALGAEDGQKVLKGFSESLLTTENTLFAFSPKMSYVSKDFAAADPEFWRPKPKMAAKPAAAPKKQVAKAGANQ